MKKIILFLMLVTLKLEAWQMIDDGIDRYGVQQWKLVLDPDLLEDQEMQGHIDAFALLFPEHSAFFSQRPALQAKLMKGILSLSGKAILGGGYRNITLPEGFWEKVAPLVFLKEIWLTNCSVKQLPQSIGGFKELETLSLTNNELENLPLEIGGLENLRTFDLTGNRLTEVPDIIGDLKNLQDFKCGGNRIVKVSQRIGELSALQLLDLSRNHIEEMPVSIENLGKLKSFYLRHNTVPISLPQTLTNLARNQGGFLESFWINPDKVQSVDGSLSFEALKEAFSGYRAIGDGGLFTLLS